MEKKANSIDIDVPKTEAPKIGFGQYWAPALFGVISKELIEDEIHSAMGRESRPIASIKDMFSKQAWKETGEVLSKAKGWKTLSIDLGVMAASFLPGALFGMWAVNGAIRENHAKNQKDLPDKVTISVDPSNLEKTSIVETSHEGLVNSRSKDISK